MSLIQGNTKVSAGGYTIDQSIRFNDDDSPRLTKTLGTATDNTAYTVSFWLKRGTLGTAQYIFSAGTSGTSTEDFWRFETNDTMGFRWAGTDRLITTQVFRDPSSWYHFVLAVDFNASGSDKAKLYVNGEEVTAFSTDSRSLLSVTNVKWNQAENHTISGFLTTGGSYFDGYISEFNFVDGQQLAATDFGETNDDGVWIPKAYAGAYGNNGFYLKGQDSAALGDDSSGNSNDFTSSGLTSDDQVSDTPTANICTMNPLDIGGPSGNVTLSNGNLVVTANSGASNQNCRGTFAMTTGKWYWEMGYTSGGSVNQRIRIGITDNQTPIYYAHNTRVAYIDGYSGNAYYQDASTSVVDSGTYVTFSAGDHMMFAFDADAGKLWFGKNGTWMGSPAGDPAAGTNASLESIPTGERWQPLCSPWVQNQGTFYFLEDTWTYTAPTGFNALSTANLPAPAIADGSAYFQTTLYSGNGSTQEINQSENSTFQPDWVWIKERNTARSHVLYDAVRGTTKYLQTNATDVEGTLSGVTSFDADGFTVGSHASSNNSGSTYAAWQWLAANGTASNTDGSITSTVSASTTAGFSAISFVGNGTAGATVGHGLSQKPSLLICKNRDSTEQWIVYCEPRGATEYGLLNSTASWASSSGAWNNTEPTSSVVTLGGGGFGTNVSSNNMIMYAFHSVPGHSFVSSYTGNGAANGPMIYTNGITPKWAIIKRVTGAAEDWQIRDIARSPYNLIDDAIYANSAAAEITGNSAFSADFLSNGIKIRTAHSGSNASGSQYLIWCFGSPFGGSGVAPATAR